MHNVLRCSLAKSGDVEYNFDIANFNISSYNDFLYGTGSNSLDFILSKYLDVCCIKDDFCIDIKFLNKKVILPSSSLKAETFVEKNGTYSCNIVVNCQAIYSEYVDGKKKFIRMTEYELPLCNIPLMTSKGSFVINGVEKIIVSQIHRAPGVYFRKEKGGKKNLSNVFVAVIIPHTGNRIELKYSKNSGKNKKENDNAGILFAFSRSSSNNENRKKNRFCDVYYLLSAVFELCDQDIINSFYSQIELSFFKDDLYSFDYDLKNALGNISAINIRGKDGNIIVKSGDLINRSLVRLFKNKQRYYLKIPDLEGCYFYNETKIGENVFDCGTLIDNNLITEIDKNKSKNFSIIDMQYSFKESFLLDSMNEFRKTFGISGKSKGLDEKIYEEKLRILMSFIDSSNSSFDVEYSKKRIEQLLFDEKSYSFEEFGRYKLNKVLKVDVPSDCFFLTAVDVVEIIKKLSDVKNGTYVPSDVDDLSNRRIRSNGEIIANRFKNGLKKVVKSAEEKLRSIDFSSNEIPLKSIINPSAIAKEIDDFFLISDLCQYMEQNNILSEISHSRRITALGEGGITRDRATREIRDIHTSHYGKICPIETPDGGNIGLITNLACYAGVNKYGFIVTPYRKVINGKLTDDVVYLDSDDEREYKISFFSREFLDYVNDDTLVSARYNGDFVHVNKSEVEYIDVAPNQAVSVVASCIPFLENNDTARALMGCNMQRQAVPLLFSDIPFVATGFERKIAKMLNNDVITKKDGVVLYSDADFICVESDDSNKENCDLDFYNLNVFKKTNHKTFANQRPVVSVGDRVKKGDIIADCASTNNGELSIGRNLLVAFVPWNGYNYEDSVVVSKKLLVNDSFTSLHIEEFEVQIREVSNGVERITNEIDSIDNEKKKMLDENGIIQVGSNVSSGDILVGKITPIGISTNTSEEKLLCAIFGESSIKNKDTSFRLPNGISGTVVNVDILTRSGMKKCNAAEIIEKNKIEKRCRIFELEKEAVCKLFSEKLSKIGKTCGTSFKTLKEEIADTPLEKSFLRTMNDIEEKLVKDIEEIKNGDKLDNGVQMLIKISVAVKSKLQPGDKISGRHGNKGVISRCVAVEDMPYMEDGTPIDLVFSPVSVPGRMNIGQILEVHLGLLSYNVGKKIDAMLEKKNAVDNIRKLLTDISFDAEFNKEVLKMKDEEVIEKAKEYRNGIYFKTPVFDSASVDDFDRIAEKLGIDNSLQVDLYDGLTGEKFDRKVTVGYMYVIKLHHLVDEKIHARSTGSYNLITQQPIGGRAHFGGQRFGEMECWALQAYGAAYTLQEMLSIKSDDIKGREKVYSSIIDGYNFRFLSNIPESFNVLCREMNAIGIDVKFGFDG